MKIDIKNAILSFSDSIRHAKPDRSGRVKHSANFICTADTCVIVEIDGEKKKFKPEGNMQKVIDRVCKEKWGKVPAKLKNWAFNKADGSGTRDEYTNQDGDYYKGYDENTWFFAASKLAEQVPDGLTIVDQQREPLPASSGYPRAGDFVNARIEIYAFEAENDQGVTASLEGIQMLKKGTPFGGGTPLDAKEAFDEEELEDDAADEDDMF